MKKNTVSHNEDIYNTLTPEEAEIIRHKRLEKAIEIREFDALWSLLMTVRGQERYQVEKMIERRGGPSPTTCPCGSACSEGLGRCYDCRDRAYG